MKLIDFLNAIDDDSIIDLRQDNTKLMASNLVKEHNIRSFNKIDFFKWHNYKIEKIDFDYMFFSPIITIFIKGSEE